VAGISRVWEMRCAVGRRMVEIANGWQAACIGLKMHIVVKRPASTGKKENSNLYCSHRADSGESVR